MREAAEPPHDVAVVLRHRELPRSEPAAQLDRPLLIGELLRVRERQVEDGDLVGTLPRTLVRVHGARFGVTALEPPLPFGPTRVRAVATKAAMTDAGVAWLVELLAQEAPNARRAAAAPKRS